MKYIIDESDMVEYQESDDFSGYILPNHHFTWDEVKSGDGKEYITTELLQKYRDNTILLTVMLEQFRDYIGESISPTNWLRAEEYTEVLIEQGYPASRTSDHEEARALDAKMTVTQDKINKWKEICNAHNVYWSIGVYSWGFHLGFRYTANAYWDYS